MLLLILSLLSRIIQPTQFDGGYMRQCLMTRISAYRPALEDSVCVAASIHHACYLAKTQTLGHYENIKYADAQYSIDERKVDGEICLTYLAYSTYYELTYEQLADKMIAAWLQSPEHKAILLNPKLSKVGLDVEYNKKDDTYYAVVNFKYN